MTPTPADAISMNIQVEGRTISPKSHLPISAARNGAVDKRNNAFATVVWVSENIQVANAIERQNPASTESLPALRNEAMMVPRRATAI